MQEKAKTGIIYARVSSWEQVSNTSLEKQVRECKSFAEKLEIEVITEPFVEEGESAKSAKRTEFQKALAYCSKYKPSYFIVYKIDRFARNQDDHVATRAFLRKFGTELRSVTEPIDESTVGRLQEGILSVFAEFDNNVRAERSKGGMMEKFRKGIWVWRAPEGYMRLTKGGNLVVDEKLAPYIRLAFEEYAKGVHSFKSLAKFLEDRGFRTRSGKKPCMQLMQKILRNPIYCATIRAWGEEHKGTFEAIVEESLYWQCQPGKRKSKFHSGPRITVNPLYPLKRFTVCSDCGKSLTGSASRGRRGTKYLYYHHHKQDCAKARSIPKAILERDFQKFLQSVSPDKEYEKVFKAIVVDVWKSNYKKLDEEHQRIDREVALLRDERQKIFRFHQEGKYTDSEFQEQKSLINERIRQREFLRDEKLVEEFDMEEALDYCFRLIRHSADTWVKLSEQPILQSRFQNQVFPEKVFYDGKKFGTNKISLVYDLNQKRRSKKSHLVTVRGIDPRFKP